MNTEAIFDESNGNYMFYSTNKKEILPGDYQFYVIGSVGEPGSTNFA